MIVNKSYFKINLVVATILLLFISCNKGGDKEQRPLAVVYDTYLYKSDITEIFPQGLTKGDSVKILNAYVDQWVRHKLMLRLSDLIVRHCCI